MKKFAFSLDRVLDWRRTQVRREEAKLERLYAERSAIDARQHNLAIERQQAETSLRSLGQVTGQELAALDSFQRHVVAEGGRMTQAREGCDREIAVQVPIVAAKRRDVKLLERLKQQQMVSWSKDVDREISQDAEESHSAKWNREHG
jgi:hypothetical protein